METTNALRDAVQAARDFKYWLDIQAPGEAFHPSGADARATDAYAKAAQLLDAAEATLKRRQIVRPAAWAVFADNGNIRIWSSASEPVRKLAEDEGMKLVPLYAIPEDWQDMQITVERREMSDYPKRDLTPEHTKRGNGHDTFSDAPIHPDVNAAYAYVDSVINTADMHAENSPAWHGWALREAFLAGVSHAENKTPNPQSRLDGEPDDIVAEMRGFADDHGPGGWPAVRMSQISALCNEIERLRKDAERYRWLRGQPMYPTWKAVAAATGEQRDTVIDSLMTQTHNAIGQRSAACGASSAPTVSAAGPEKGD